MMYININLAKILFPEIGNILLFIYIDNVLLKMFSLKK